MIMENYIDKGAAEFSAHSESSGARLGYVVACCVKLGVGEGGDTTVARATVVTEEGKVSASEFARRSKTSADRVLRHLRAWARAAEDGRPHPDDLTPPDIALQIALPSKAEWRRYFAEREGGPKPKAPKPKPTDTRTKPKNGTRLRELAAARREGDNHILPQMETLIRRLTTHLAAFRLGEYVADEWGDTATYMESVYEALVNHAIWVKDAITYAHSHLDDHAVRQRIAALRNVEGRLPEEAELYLAQADLLERQLENRLNSGSSAADTPEVSQNQRSRRR